MGKTDASTLEIAKDAIMRQASDLIAQLTALENPAAMTNALAVHPAGVIEGVDQEFTGRIERVDHETLHTLLRADIIPVLPPLGYDGKGATLRLNSDAVAVETAIALNAAKVIFLAESGVQNDGQRVAQLSAANARDIYRKKELTQDINLLSKLRYGALACEEGVPRVHIVNGTFHEALLMELFSNEGVGTMIHGDEYQQIRAARAGDVNALLNMMQLPMEDAALASRSRENILAHMDDYFVLEVDGNPIGSVAVHRFDHDGVPSAELACLFVQRAHKNKGHGRRLVAFAEDTARSRGCQRMVALSTQAFRFFEEKMGYTVTDPSALSAQRRTEYSQNGRNSKVLVKPL
jgi:amino-acid N-acetyltransferase